MNNPIIAHINRLLAERVGGKTRAELIAGVLVEEALKGDVVAIRVVLDAIESFDPTTESAWSEDEDQ